MITQILPHPPLDPLFISSRCILLFLLGLLTRNHKSRHDLPVSLIRDTDDRNVPDSRMGQKTVFDLEGVDVFATADDEVFDAAGYGNVAVCGEGGFVACLFIISLVRFLISDLNMFVFLKVTYVHPHFPIIIRNHNFSRSLWVIPVFFHKQVPGNSQFTSLTDRHDTPVRGIDHLRLDMGHESPDGINASINRVVCRGHSRHGTRLGHPIADS